MKTGIGILVLAAILLCFVCLPVRAQLITIAISGQVTSVSDQYGHFENKIQVGDTITGTYTYDSTIPDSLPEPTVGSYDNYAFPAGISLAVSGFNFKTDPTNVNFALSVTNNDLLGYDYYGMISRNNLSLPNSTPVQYIYWGVGDSTGTALSNDALPLTAPDLSRWDSSILNIIHDRDFEISATITSAVLVPEPATLLLLVFGIAILKRR